eukprot:Nitzschia sp. Nitz4//scaffold477_size5520//4765//5277//NITZ4_009221-RA/size5520-processed-gene-0.0-mRNA-1//1//CDS//3329552728//5698//frame0
MGTLHGLTSLYLSVTSMSGTVPTKLGNLAALGGLYISENELTGTIPTQLGRMAAMTTTLDLSNNELPGTIPREIGSQMVYLETLELHSNDLTETIPLELGNLAALQIVQLQENDSLLAPVPDEVCALPFLAQLETSLLRLLSYCIVYDIGTMAQEHTIIAFIMTMILSSY